MIERKGPNGTRLYAVEDIDRTRWLWTTRWPAHESQRSCPNAPHPWRYRYGHAPTKREALEAADVAAVLPEPRSHERVSQP